MSQWLARPGAVPSSTPVPVSEHARWWSYAQACAVAFRLGEAPPEIDVFGPVLDHDECVYFSATAQYARLYGGDGSYTTNGFVAFGRPAVMAGALAASAYVNHRRKVAARREAVSRWRDQQQSMVIGTSSRLMVNTVEHGWLSFYYSAVNEYAPDLPRWALTLGFGSQCVPMQLVGPCVPAAAVLVSVALDPQRWWRDPRLGPLLTG
ncbi:hypothetical protein [Mycolicibacterium iranicum]|uniref:DUF2236 domain-containing protein n=1 Tax=Mycolicibacterium iranicum TaxID=912594 RepID=A0ABT4HKE4_MYCIR|nr:hypothetical protein [Mycolicibacterium iranicum]MCZ0730658.1 hypothetical protein [Mycolicibacterium iranicum]